MKIALIVPFEGKHKYQDVYDQIIKVVEASGHQIASPEKSTEYKRVVEHGSRLHDGSRAHYEFMRKSILDSDAVIVEASWEDFRVGHEATLALLYRKPVFALSQLLDLSKYIHHPDFAASKYVPSELPQLITSFLESSVFGGLKNKPNAPLPWLTATRTIAVFGGVYADIFNRVDEIPKADEAVLSSNFKMSLGGKATNAAVALSRLGNEVFICGRRGHDAIGEDLEAALLHENIHTDFLDQDREASTGTVSLAVNKKAKFSTIVNEAANVQVSKESVDEIFKQVDAGKIQLDCVYLTLEPQEEIVEYIIRQASKRRLFIFCDAAPDTRPLQPSLLNLVSIVAPNELEAEAMIGNTVNDFDSAERAAVELQEKGAPKVLITLGAKGALFKGGSTLIRQKAVAVDAIDEAGAGDAYRASFVHQLLHGADVKTAMEVAAKAGAYAVVHFGSYDSMPTTSQIEAFPAVV